MMRKHHGEKHSFQPKLSFCSKYVPINTFSKGWVRNLFDWIGMHQISFKIREQKRLTK